MQCKEQAKSHSSCSGGSAALWSAVHISRLERSVRTRQSHTGAGLKGQHCGMRCMYQAEEVESCYGKSAMDGNRCSKPEIV
eukprot:1159839-Pelagomonas_calceolata.AAC.6